MLFTLSILLMAGPVCHPGAFAHVDDEVVEDVGAAELKRIEELTGLQHSKGSSALTAVEKRAWVAVAKRLALWGTRREIAKALDRRLSDVAQAQRLKRVLATVGRSAFIRWEVEPRYAYERLHDYFEDEVTTAVRKRAESVLGLLLSGQSDIETLKDARQADMAYGRFRLTPNRLLEHYSRAQQDDYLERLRDFESGKISVRPQEPTSPVEEVNGLGLGHAGYVKQMAQLLDSLDDGAWSTLVVRDQHQWLLIRRLSVYQGVYEGECLRFPIAPFHQWLVSMYRRLAYKSCSPDKLAQLSALAPSNPFVELLQ